MSLPPSETPLSREEILALQARAAAGSPPSLDELRRFIATTRASFLAAESRAKKTPKVKPPPVSEDQQDLGF